MPKKMSDSSRPAATSRSRAPRKGNGALAAPQSANDSGLPRSTEPSYDQIAEAAYQRFLQRGGTHGDDFTDWLEAERELRSRTR